MVEHKQLLKFAKDEDDYPVMLYLTKIGLAVDWKENSPDEVIYIPEEVFQSVARSFIDKIGTDGYYNKTILDNSHVELLCGNRETNKYSEQYQVTLAAIRQFIESGLKKSNSHYLAFEGP